VDFLDENSLKIKKLLVKVMNFQVIERFSKKITFSHSKMLLDELLSQEGYPIHIPPTLDTTIVKYVNIPIRT